MTHTGSSSVKSAVVKPSYKPSAPAPLPAPPPVYKTTSSTKKPSTTFGIFWIPTKRHNRQKKDIYYNPHKDDHRTERAPSTYPFMPTETHDKHFIKESDSTMPERVKISAGTVSAVGVVSTTDQINKELPTTPDKRQIFHNHNLGETKEAAGDATEHEYLDNDTNCDAKWDKDKVEDKVDSVFMRPPPPHKTRSAASSNNEEEDCGIKCLYYTLQCCDCSIM